MAYKELWVAPQILFERYGLNDGFIRALEMELILSDTERQIKKIQHIIAELVSKAVISPVQLLQRIAILTASATDDVRDTVRDLANQFAEIASGGTKPELKDTKLRF